MIQKFSHSIESVVSCLKQGGVVLIPTDTVYGLAVHPSHPSAVERLYEIKNRPRSRPLPVMVDSHSQLATLGVHMSKTAIHLLQSPFIPGPLTLVFELTASSATWLKGREEVAVRIPNDEYLRTVLHETGPLFVTSANDHGSSTHEQVVDILAQLRDHPDLVIDGGRRGTMASTIVNCRHQPPIIEREGCVSRAELQPFLTSDSLPHSA